MSLLHQEWLREILTTPCQMNTESITFCKLNNEDEGKVTSMDKGKYPAWLFTMCCYLMTL